MVSLLYAQLVHCIGINDVCDSLRHHAAKLLAIRAIDSSTIALVANCMDWAEHRWRKAAATLQLRLNLQSFQAGLSQWSHRFTRLFTMIRSVVWDRFNLNKLLRF